MKTSLYIDPMMKKWARTVKSQTWWIPILATLTWAPCDAIEMSEVAVASMTLPAPKIDIQDINKFLNDLKLSPYWYVQKDERGNFSARARSVAEREDSEAGLAFLFEWMAETKPASLDGKSLHNDYLHSRDAFSSFSIELAFQKPLRSDVSFGTWGDNVKLRAFESWEKEISANSSSELAIKLSEKHDIYLLLHEQGADKTRKATTQKLTVAIQELEHLVNLPDPYLTSDVYKAFFGLLFKQPYQASTLGRFPHFQSRDTFYGYFKSTKNVSYEGINLKVSHSVYCPVEGTRMSDRLRKSEYLGKPQAEGDLLFFMIEDNAVYLSPEYNKRFGIFSGTESFDATLQVFNGDGTELLNSTQKFRGWER